MPTLIFKAMTPNNSKNPFFFSVKHIIKPHTSKLIYGIRYDNLDYFLQKTHSVDNCEQLDDNPKLAPEAFKNICEIISEIEKGYQKTPPLELINMDVFNVITKANHPSHNNGNPDKAK